MTNKERLQRAAERAFGYNKGGCYADGRNEDLEALLSLIDRQPSEEEMMALRCGIDLIEYEINLYFNGDVSEDREQVFKSIRKALGIEGKE